MPRILVVDDAAMDRRLAGGILEKAAEFEVDYANDGQDALAMVELHMPELVLTDMQMPNMNGLELTEALKSNYPLIPVILMTNQGSEEIAVEALEKGAASYVPKRLLPQDLVEVVQRVLAASSEQRVQTRLLKRLIRSRMDFELENDVTLLSSLASFLRQTLRDVQAEGNSDHLRVGIALEEALLNAFYHGNLEISSELREVDYSQYYQLAKDRCQLDPYQARKIYVTAEITSEKFQCTIRDEGLGFDLNALPDPRDPMNLDRPSGRGILLMKTFMDEVDYRDGGREVVLVKLHQPVDDEEVDEDILLEDDD